MPCATCFIPSGHAEFLLVSYSYINIFVFLSVNATKKKELLLTFSHEVLCRAYLRMLTLTSRRLQVLTTPDPLTTPFVAKSRLLPGQVWKALSRGEYSVNIFLVIFQHATVDAFAESAPCNTFTSGEAHNVGLHADGCFGRKPTETKRRNACCN